MKQTDNNATKFEPGDIVEVTADMTLSTDDGGTTLLMFGREGEVVVQYTDWGGNEAVLVKFDGFTRPILASDLALKQKAEKSLRQIAEEKVEPMKRDFATPQPATTKAIPADTYDALHRLGILNTSVRAYNRGGSDYSQHIIQPWSVIQEYRLNYWDGDIIKRVLRHKQGDPRRLDYEKIIHICEERIRQIEAEEEG